MVKYKLRITGDLGFEVWQDIEGYEGLYQVSTYGRVRNIERYVLRKNGRKYFCKSLILKPYFISVGGYKSVHLCVDKKHNNTLVHRIVACTFLPNPFNFLEVNHIDENKENNRVENLEWCTHIYNINYGTCVERSVKHRQKPINQYDKQYNLIHTYNSITEASNVAKIPLSTIFNCLTNRTKIGKGYIWRYA